MTEAVLPEPAPPESPARPPRLPALVQAGAVGVVLAVVAAVSLTARQPPPPTVAEYAPQAVAQIQQAPPEQTVDPGRSSGTTTTAVPGSPEALAASSTTSTTREVIAQPRVRLCSGTPPRQIADPQSPPCVPYFDPKADNGGATSRGVTRNEINVFYTPDFLEDVPRVDKLKDFFNKRFEFYGRQLVLKSHTASGGVDPDPKLMQADAQKAYDVPVFASLNYPSRRGAEFGFYDALADRKIVSVAHRVQAQATEKHFRERSPYQWSAVPTVDSMLRNYGQFVCNALAGPDRRPEYAGGAEARVQRRKFGMIVQQASDGTAPDPAPLKAELAKCGETDVPVAYNKVTSQTGRTATSVIVQMTDAGVTSVICLCEPNETRDTLMPAASAQVYQPEWLVGTYLDNDLDSSMSGGPPDQISHVLGLVFRNKLLARQDMPFYWALKEMDPAGEPSGGAYYALQARYGSLLVLSSGIQMAGPRLTPSSFAAGLLRTKYPNPGAGGPPYYQAAAGFDGGRHTFIDDAAMFWYDPGRPSTVNAEQAGSVCYVRGGARYRLGNWPVGPQPFFEGPCT